MDEGGREVGKDKDFSVIPETERANRSAALWILPLSSCCHGGGCDRECPLM